MKKIKVTFKDTFVLFSLNFKSCPDTIHLFQDPVFKDILQFNLHLMDWMRLWYTVLALKEILIVKLFEVSWHCSFLAGANGEEGCHCFQLSLSRKFWSTILTSYLCLLGSLGVEWAYRLSWWGIYSYSPLLLSNTF